MPRFTDRDPDFRPKRFAEVFRWAVWDRLTGRRTIAPPGPGAPRMEPDLGRLASPPPGGRITWLGHAGFLVELGGARILIDPVLAPKVGPYRRHVEPGLLADQLGTVDLLAISHSHYDHLDASTVAGLPRHVAIRVPLGLGRFFHRRGFFEVVELDWWQTDQLNLAGGQLTTTLVPARHWSSRLGPIDINTSLWGGFVFQAADRTAYHAGDTGWFDQFPKIAEAFPELDVAMLPIGAYDPPWFMEAQHMNPEQALRAFDQLGARRLVPMHWGCFQLTDESLAEPPRRLRHAWEARSPDQRELWTLDVGETRDF